MEPGELIDGKYRVDARLGEGGMGLVLEATHVLLGSKVAIKVLKPEAVRITEVCQRFVREARAAGRLRSEHTARVVDVGQLASGQPYMVMEMLRGRDLATAARKRRLPVAVVADYIVQACEGLAEAHSLGMVHRDIKPANLFLSEQPNGQIIVKVLDFGIATAPDGDIDHGLTKTISIMGSPSYMSPEQLRSSKLVDARSDIWSLGVTLFRLVSGQQPFVGETFSALSIAVATEPHPRLEGIEPAFADIVDRCLEKRPDDRFATVAELAAALATLFPEGAVAAERVVRSLRRSLPPPYAPRLSEVMVSPTQLPSGYGAEITEPPSQDSSIDPPSQATLDQPGSTTRHTSGESLSRPTRRGRLVWGIVGGLAAGVVATVLVMQAIATPAVTPVDAVAIVVRDAAIAHADAAVVEPIDAAMGPPSLAHARLLQPTDPLAALAETERLVDEPDQSAVHALRAALLFATDYTTDALTELLAVADRRAVDADTIALVTAFAKDHPTDALSRRVMAKLGLVKRRKDPPKAKAPCKPSDPACGL